MAGSSTAVQGPCSMLPCSLWVLPENVQVKKGASNVWSRASIHVPRMQDYVTWLPLCVQSSI